MRIRMISPIATALAATAIMLSATPSAVASDSNKWRIECDDSAHSDGDVVFRVTPKGSAPTEVTVKIAKGTSENKVAVAIEDAFRAQLPKEAYHIERDDGEDVLVKRKSGAADFNLMLVSSTVENVEFEIEKE